MLYLLDHRQRIPESSCARKKTVDIGILVTSRNDDRKIMQSIRITSRPSSRIRKQNHFKPVQMNIYQSRVCFRLKLNLTSRRCPQLLIFFKNLFYQNNCKEAVNIEGDQIRGTLFNFFVVKKCPFLYLPDTVPSFKNDPYKVIPIGKT